MAMCEPCLQEANSSHTALSSPPAPVLRLHRSLWPEKCLFQLAVPGWVSPTVTVVWGRESPCISFRGGPSLELGVEPI